VKLLPSLAARFLVGSIVWTAGLLYVAHVSFVLVFLGPGAFAPASHAPAILILAIALMTAGAVVARRGLAAFTELRARLAAVREGRERQIGGDYPTEVQPLVDDLNALLAHRDRRVREAVMKAGNLAHGLKTPLAVLAQEADRADVLGQHELATMVRQQVERMERQVDYHLAHARAAASGAMPGARCAVLDSVEGLARTLQRLHAGRGIAIDVTVSADHAVRGQREDLDEMLGNLLDNACKWARARVAVGSEQVDGLITIVVDDDGPGIDPSLRAVVLQHGVRADEAAPGSGFGLAIVRDLAEVYGGRIALERAPIGGLRARLELPAAKAAER
jgi:signal transduction histidine kinase